MVFTTTNTTFLCASRLLYDALRRAVVAAIRLDRRGELTILARPK